MSNGYRLGVVHFLNAEPLVWPLENGQIEHPHQIIRAAPSDLVPKLVKGELDCSLAPVAIILDNPDFIQVPDIAIACRGPVASVLLFHNGSFEKLDTIWLDPASATSNLLIQVLRERASEFPCEFKLPDGEESPPLENLPLGTGRLLIGDPALTALAPGHRIMPPTVWTDLGELWRNMTGHPFTFARWITRVPEVAAELKDLLREARDWSVLHLHEIVGPLAEKYHYPVDLVDRYLRTNIVYMHGPRELAGEREFFIQVNKLFRDRENASDA